MQIKKQITWINIKKKFMEKSKLIIKKSGKKGLLYCEGNYPGVYVYLL